MKQFRVEGLTSTYGEKKLLNNVSFLLETGDRVGIVGVNGTGKTTLLNALENIKNADSGKITHQNDFEIGYLKQDPEFDDELTIMDAIFAGKQKLYQIIKHYEDCLKEYTNNPLDADIQKQFEKSQRQMDESDAWQADIKIKTILSQLKMPNLNLKIKDLSGGQKKRVGLAQILVKEPDLLLLDEPTNHLDFDSINWLEKYLAKYSGIVVTISHDRWFLDAVTNRIFELSFGDLYEYKGNYQSYVDGKIQRIESEKTEYKKKEKLYKQELEWMRKSAPARTTKQSARENRFADLKNSLSEGVNEDEKLNVNLGQTRIGKKGIIIKDAKLKFEDKKILDGLNYRINPGERIGISGDNGTGKSTLLNCIAGLQELDSGSIEIGETLKIAYYRQKTEYIPEDKRVINYLSESATSIKDKDGNVVSVSELLEQFLFPSFMHGTLIRKLSGGEKRRLYLLKILLTKPNVLLLDEPTNDLDIDTLTVLENFIHEFEGTVITVSHDRYFLDKIADKILYFDGDGKIETYQGMFSQILNTKLVDKEEQTNKVKNIVVQENKKTKKKLSYSEKKEWEVIETEISEIEDEIASLNNELENIGSDYMAASDIQSKLDTLEEQLIEKMDRWEYLSEIVEGENG